jgi:hypothetical protein
MEQRSGQAEVKEVDHDTPAELVESFYLEGKAIDVAKLTLDENLKPQIEKALLFLRRHDLIGGSSDGRRIWLDGAFRKKLDEATYQTPQTGAGGGPGAKPPSARVAGARPEKPAAPAKPAAWTPPPSLGGSRISRPAAPPVVPLEPLELEPAPEPKPPKRGGGDETKGDEA